MDTVALNHHHLSLKAHRTANVNRADELDIVDEVDLGHLLALHEHVGAQPAQFEGLSHEEPAEDLAVKVAVLQVH
jgi:metallophosphoesterase superfamily enzyme